MRGASAVIGALVALLIVGRILTPVERWWQMFLRRPVRGGNCPARAFGRLGVLRGLSRRTLDKPPSHFSPSTTISLAILQYSSLWWPAATKASASVAVIVHARVWLFQRARGQAARRTSTSCGFHENRTSRHF